ncbi:2-amino-4-hydroxy-6-hydroxymethyldihydropteridine diphosphokinase [Caulobacter mirabilis]|uniref:2-amino-4-hydroxy-6-hydroxymethyldihydropteridine pyrophosphokinase n=1 Tax=Caulobacter mirabilis TaxID=69666 RepID=A0A2D2B3Y1_9CAUL|nr:2-amino-4-hydroxy-6-hydroxymethyldihydropteridine diphosphokinase [Caulobacter mirabilis]
MALGSNLAGPYGSCEALLEAALAAFPARGLTVIARSGWWRSAAWPDPTAPAFVNGVVLAETRSGPAEALAILHALERDFGRVRSETNAARTLDLDLIAHGRAVLAGPGLVLPHPRAHERLFVMGPLAQVAPEWRHPTLSETAADLAARATVGADATPL